ncbi:SRPBCC domain-containing protein [Nakamurella sp.]|uniref:SRPBCC domain-containing protein n=1 Tax=Nakamurella sp. TaxID=1869182 RepID=UPI003785213C
MSTTPVGLTRDAGFEIGVSRTVDLPPDQVWRSLVSDDGVATWLGAGVRLPDPAAAKGTRYRTTDGTRGEIRSLHPTGRLRLTWQPPDWDHESTVQVTVSVRGGRTVIRFHQERLSDPAERARQREHWRAVLDAVVDRLG